MKKGGRVHFFGLDPLTAKIPSLCSWTKLICGVINVHCRHTNWKIRSLSIRAAVCWFLAVTVWVNDKFLCEIFWNDFPYLHALWHVLIAITALKACVLFSYFQVTQEHPEYIVSLRYAQEMPGFINLIQRHCISSI